MTAPTSRQHLVIGTPCYGGLVNNAYVASLLKLQLACVTRGIDFEVLMLGGDALITRARQNVVAHFLGIEAATHLLFIDADISFEPEQVLRLMDFGADMTAATYPAKHIDWEKVAAAAETKSIPLDAAGLTYVLEVHNPEEPSVRDGFVRVRYAGTGFLLIKRQALVSMIEHYPELRYAREHQAPDPLRGSPWRSALFNCFIDEATGLYLSEDYSFCRRWTGMDGEIWVDLRSQLTHIGPMSFHGAMKR